MLQSYFYNDDMFNYNYGQAKAATGNYKEAEEVRITRTCMQHCLLVLLCRYEATLTSNAPRR